MIQRSVMNPEPVIRVSEPCPALRSFVRCYTFLYLSCGEPLVRIQPAFAAEYLIFYPHDSQKYSDDGKNYNRLPQELIIGPFIQPVYLLQSSLQIMILVNLFPGTLHRFIHLPMNEILNQPLEGINGFGNEIRKVNERLAACDTPERMIEIIEAFLLKRLEKIKDPFPIDHVFKLVRTSPQQHTIDQLADLACVSFRQFERQFLNRIGMTPTMYIRLARFGKAYHLKRARPELTWTSIAHECGYFDQMHLIREFKLFTSATPRSFKSILPASTLANA